MLADTTKKPTRKRLALTAIGLCIGGLAPLATGVVGLWQYLDRGYFSSKTGDHVEGPLAVVASGVFILVGVAMIAHALVSYIRKTRGG